MHQTIKCPNCGTENQTINTICSTCKGELKRMLDTTATFVHAPEKIKTGPQIDIDGLQPGEKAVFVVKKGPILGQRLPIQEGDTIIGRDPKADIFLNDITVSRRHAKIIMKDDQATVKDMGSLNGSYLNNERFTESPLENHDELQIGKFLLVFLSK